MYDLESEAIQRMADAFARGDKFDLTPAQMQTIAFALRAKPDWVDGFIACAYLFSGSYDRYAKLRDAWQLAKGRN